MGKITKGINDLLTLRPDLAAEWHPTKNNINPEDVTISTHKKVWWICKNNHEWEASIANRARLMRSCPYCTHQLPIVGETDLKTIAPDIAKEWHPTKNGSLKPSDIMPGTHKMIWWQCKLGHEWQAQVKSRVAGVGCPYCSNRKILIGFNDLATVKPELAAEWHPTKNSFTPKDVSFGSGKKIWWICKNKHEYQASIVNRSKGRGCPICSSRRRTSFPEQAIYFYIKKTFPDAINSYKDIFPNGMELDVYIPSLKTGIEYDGSAFHKTQTVQIRDNRKYQICKKNGIQLIRIYEWIPYSPLIKADHSIEIPNAKAEYLNYAISKLILKIGANADVNIARDRIKILEQLNELDKSLASEHPDIAAEWHPTKNGDLKPTMVHPGSNEKVWWMCKTCKFEWKTSIAERTGRDKTNCPQCSRKRTASAHKKPVYMLNDEGLIIKQFDSITDASKATGTNNSHIADVCNGKRKTAGGYKWKYKN